jgi:DNA-directed RNA polymerase subunit RPC12/RpoP
MKLPCTECSKKISIDDAFAGGVCRCPYCRALVFVPEDKRASTAGGGRPDSPDEERPDSPEDLKAMAESQGKRIPLATPVKVQGIVTLVLLGVLLAMIAVTVTYLMVHFGGNEVENGEEPVTPGGFTEGPIVNPYEPAKGMAGPWVAGNVPIRTPVIYVVDGGGSMGNYFDSAGLITRMSIRRLGESDTFNVLVSQDASGGGGTKPVVMMDDRWRMGAHERVAKVFLEKCNPRGLTDVPGALKAALALGPKTIVLFCAKGLGESQAAAMAVATEAKDKGVAIMTIALGGGQVKEDMAALAKESGGHTRQYFLENLSEYDYPMDPK